MGVKKRSTNQLQWTSANPAPFVPGTAASGVTGGAMASTNTIYSQILDMSNTDNAGIEIAWTGSAVGTISVMCSEGGTNFYSLTFTPALTQPAGSSGGYLIDCNQIPWRYIMIQYTNSSSTGTLTGYLGQKDLN